MATARDWADAFRAQAAEDLRAAKALEGRAPSVLAMLLQMVFEKLGKAALLRSGQIALRQARRSHAAASRMLAVLKRDKARRSILGAGNPYAFKDVLPMVRALERAHPQLAEPGQPQLEYPWEAGPGAEIRWPARDLALARQLGGPRSLIGARLLKLASQLEQRFDQVFPA